MLPELVDSDDRDQIARVLATATGLIEGSTSPLEIAWATHRLLEALSIRQPVVVVLDDLHCADPVLLDVLTSVIDRLGQSPVLVLLLSRLITTGPDGPLAERRSLELVLSPLSDDESAQLIELTIGTALKRSVQENVIATAGGNPLFVNEMISMLIDDGLLEEVDGVWQETASLGSLEIPLSIETLLESRLDALLEETLITIERAVIEGQTFSRRAILALSDPSDQDAIDVAIDLLIDRNLIVERESQVVGSEPSYAFRHVLIREVAYRRIPKRIRSELHERFARWLEEEGGRSADVDEIAGYHLEQAHRYRAELFRPGPAEVLLAAHGASKLERAGQRALSRSDLRGAIGLLRRSSELLGEEMGLRIQPLLGAVLGEAGQLEEANAKFDYVIDEATRVGSDHLVAQARIEKMILRLQTDPVDVPQQVEALGPELRKPLEQLGHLGGLARFWHLKALVQWNDVHCERAANAWQQSVTYARSAGDTRRLADGLSWQASAAFYGPMSADDGIILCEDIIGQLGEDRLARSQVMLSMACLQAMAGRRDRAASLVAESDRTLAAIGPHLHAAAPHREAFVAMVGGDPIGAERRLSDGMKQLRSMGEHALMSTSAAMLAHALIAQGRSEEALPFTIVGETEADADDVATHVAWRTARAKVLSTRGDYDVAVELGRAAVDLADQTDCLVARGDALRDLAEVLFASGDAGRAGKLLASAAEVYDQKGHVVGVGRCRVRQAALRS